MNVASTTLSHVSYEFPRSCDLAAISYKYLIRFSWRSRSCRSVDATLLTVWRWRCTLQACWNVEVSWRWAARWLPVVICSLTALTSSIADCFYSSPRRSVCSCGRAVLETALYISQQWCFSQALNHWVLINVNDRLLLLLIIQWTTRMWANAQTDGRPAKHRWRPLFNAAKFGWRPLLDAVQ